MEMALERLDKIIASTGRWSRREVKNLIRQGRVLVNGMPPRSAEEKADPETAEIVVNGETITYRRYTWIMLNKPAGYLSATEDGRGKTVLDLLPPELQKQKLFPVGRLDKDTEGLLLLTNQGSLAHDLLSPRHHVDKVYYTRVSGFLTEEDCAAFAAGMTLDDGLICLPAGLEILSAGEESEARVTLREIPSDQAYAGSAGEAGGVSGADRNGQSAVGSCTGERKIPVFDGKRGGTFTKSLRNPKANSNLHQKAGDFFVEKRKNILRFDENADIM